MKTAAFVVIAGLGLTHYVFRRIPKPRTRWLKLPLRAEAGAIAVAVALATVLVGFPNPPRETEAAEHPEDEQSLGALAQRDAVSVAQGSGPFVVGLSLVPARPGPAEFRVDVLGVEPGDALREARLRGSNGSGSMLQVPLSACGSGCFEGEGVIDSAGDWQVSIDIVSNRGMVALDASIPMPTPDGHDDGVVVRQEMRAEGHIMDDHYSEFNGPLEIRPPR